MTKFKQIIGRGTRIDDRYNKLWFTIVDFKKATELFADERFDGIPEKVITTNSQTINSDDGELEHVLNDPCGEESETITEGAPDTGNISSTDHGPTGTDNADLNDDERKVRKFHVNGVMVKAIAERVQYYDTDGKLVTESFKDYTRKTMARQFSSLDEFIKKWQSAQRKQAIIDELESEGVLWEVLAEEVGKDLDPFDLICHVVYDQPPLTRKERAENVKKRNYFTKYSDTAQAVLTTLLDKYADAGVQEIENKNVLKVAPFTAIGRPIEIVKKGFGKPADYEQAISDLEAEIYRSA